MKTISKFIIRAAFAVAALLFLSAEAWCIIQGTNSPAGNAGSFYKTDLNPATIVLNYNGTYSATPNIQWIGSGVQPPVALSYLVKDTAIQNPTNFTFLSLNPVWKGGQGLTSAACTIMYYQQEGGSTTGGAMGSIAQSFTVKAMQNANNPAIDCRFQMTFTIQIPGDYVPGQYTTLFTMPNVINTNGQSPQQTWEEVQFKFEFLAYLGIENYSSLDFGRARPLSGQTSTIIVGPNNTRGGTADIIQTSSFHPAEFGVFGSPNTPFTVTLPSYVTLIGPDSVTGIRLDTFTSSLPAGVAPHTFVGVTDPNTAAAKHFTIGGTVTYPSKETALFGTYRGTIAVRIDY